VTLAAASGYTFNGVVADAFSHDGAPGAVTNGANSGTVTIVFPATTGVTAATVTDLDLTLKVSAPATGDAPATYFAAPHYTGTVAWAPSPPGDFAENTKYTATVTLTAAPGYTFAGMPEKPEETEVAGAFTHSKGTVAHNAGKANSPLVVTIAFQKTGLAPVEAQPIIIPW
jgi:hypothetical protein